MRPSPPPPTCGVIRGIFRCSLFLGVVGFVAAAIAAHALWRKTDKLVEMGLAVASVNSTLTAAEETEHLDRIATDRAEF